MFIAALPAAGRLAKREGDISRRHSHNYHRFPFLMLKSYYSQEMYSPHKDNISFMGFFGAGKALRIQVVIIGAYFAGFAAESSIPCLVRICRVEYPLPPTVKNRQAV